MLLRMDVTVPAKRVWTCWANEYRSRPLAMSDEPKNQRTHGALKAPREPSRFSGRSRTQSARFEGSQSDTL